MVPKAKRLNVQDATSCPKPPLYTSNRQRRVTENPLDSGMEAQSSKDVPIQTRAKNPASNTHFQKKVCGTKAPAHLQHLSEQPVAELMAPVIMRWKQELV